jgi:hypothetical protein
MKLIFSAEGSAWEESKGENVGPNSFIFIINSINCSRLYKKDVGGGGGGTNPD